MFYGLLRQLAVCVVAGMCRERSEFQSELDRDLLKHLEADASNKTYRSSLRDVRLRQ
jgi:hypothetical protein